MNDTRYFRFSCQLGTQDAYIEEGTLGWMETGWEWREIESIAEQDMILSRYEEISKEEFDNEGEMK